MAVELKKEFKCFNNLEQVELRRALGAAQDDIAALKTAIDAMAAKLNADTGVTDTDYAGVGALNLVD